jgi:predicted RNA-binding protein
MVEVLKKLHIYIKVENEKLKVGDNYEIHDETGKKVIGKLTHIDEKSGEPSSITVEDGNLRKFLVAPKGDITKNGWILNDMEIIDEGKFLPIGIPVNVMNEDKEYQGTIKDVDKKGNTYFIEWDKGQHIPEYLKNGIISEEFVIPLRQKDIENYSKKENRETLKEIFGLGQEVEEKEEEKPRKENNVKEIGEKIKDFNAEQMEDLIGTWLARRYDPGPGAQLLRDMANRYDY